MLCSNNVSILHRFRDVTAFKVHMTACDLEKSFRFDETIEITSRVCFLIYM